MFGGFFARPSESSSYSPSMASYCRKRRPKIFLASGYRSSRVKKLYSIGMTVGVAMDLFDFHIRPPSAEEYAPLELFRFLFKAGRPPQCIKCCFDLRLQSLGSFYLLPTDRLLKGLSSSEFPTLHFSLVSQRYLHPSFLLVPTVTASFHLKIVKAPRTACEFFPDLSDRCDASPFATKPQKLITPLFMNMKNTLIPAPLLFFLIRPLCSVILECLPHPFPRFSGRPPVRRDLPLWH